MEEFSDRLADAMDKRGMKQVDLCAATGLSSAQVNHLVNGRTKDPKISTAALIADALGISLDYLAGRKTPDVACDDPYQQELNDCWEQSSDDGRRTIISVARSVRQTTGEVAQRGDAPAQEVSA